MNIINKILNGILNLIEFIILIGVFSFLSYYMKFDFENDMLVLNMAILFILIIIKNKNTGGG